MNLLVWVVFFLVLTAFVMIGLYIVLILGCAIMTILSELFGLKEEIEEEIDEEIEEELQEENVVPKEVIVILNPNNNIEIGLKH